ncbi:hypothetical protein RR46_08261 [Papilio xuthus]|uniref:Uncharacterized protein n=1 Tax=Papilio xuthus TaxID=66420 RepID=A0A194PL53_PAPXU|nr:hypothetical protein RR46_08261 [Papilio xuthus]
MRFVVSSIRPPHSHSRTIVRRERSSSVPTEFTRSADCRPTLFSRVLERERGRAGIDLSASRSRSCTRLSRDIRLAIVVGAGLSAVFTRRFYPFHSRDDTRSS